ncbi:MAG: hypothetical protein OXI41_03170 [Chloroflexota bacterium]|nr:hypothetical protein [Chloroflexota bacterium]
MIIDILRPCAEGDLFTAGMVALDGARLRAQASHGRSRAPWQLEAEVERTLSDTERVEVEKQRWDGGWQALLVPNTVRGREQRHA